MKRISLLLISLVFSFQAIAKDPGSWLMNYYKSPNPQDFVAEVNKLSKTGLLGNPKHKENIAVFLSRILASHPENTNEWLQSLKSLNKTDMEPVFYAVWLADTKESKEYLKSIGATEVLNTKPINYLQTEIQSPNTLDALWSYFYASDSKEPVRRIVSALNYADYSGFLEAYKTSKQTGEDRRKAILDSIFQAARWSLESNARNEPKIGEICGNILKDPNITKNEQLWLGVILSKAIPDKYKMVQVKAGEWRLETHK